MRLLRSKIAANPGQTPIALPYRGHFGAARPAALAPLALPPGPMPARDGVRPLKAWRYVGVYGPELMICVAAVRLGPARQSFWAVWDRAARELVQRTRLGRAGVSLERGTVRVRDRALTLDLRLEEAGGVETVCASGDSYAWTRKQGGILARGTLRFAHGRGHAIDARAVIDDTAAYYERHTSWQWSAGVGQSREGHELAWNLVNGVNDPASGSERTVWVDGVPHEVGPVDFAPDLSGVGGLRFDAEATREHDQNLLLVRSSYRQPFGTFSGTLPGAIALAQGFGVMEDHDAWW